MSGLSEHFLFVTVNKYLQRAVLVVLLAGLVSCGFQLRGAYQLPVAMGVTYVDTQAIAESSALSRILIRRLKASDIKIADKASDDVAVLMLLGEQKTKRIVSVDSRGRAREYTLTYSIRFNVKAVNEKFEIDEQDVRIDRDFVFDTEDVLGNSREESKLYEEMQADVIRLILLRLQSKS